MIVRILLSFAALTVVALAGQAPEGDQQKLQGTWKILAGNESGKTLPPGAVRGSKLVVSGDILKVFEQEKQREMSFTLDAKKDPKEIDMKVTQGKRKGELARGIYELQGDKLKICFAPPGKARPSNFTPGPGSGEMLFVLKRAEK